MVFLASSRLRRRGSEILRLEPVVGRLYRRATADVRLNVEGGTVTIPKGSLMELRTHAVNADETVVGGTR